VHWQAADFRQTDDLERKSIEPIALRYAEDEKEVRNMQNFSQKGAWDEEKMLETYQILLSDKIAEPDGMLTFDDSGFPKKGNETVGTARQYCGRLGKTNNCQAGVFIGYSSHVERHCARLCSTGSNSFGSVSRPSPEKLRQPIKFR